MDATVEISLLDNKQRFMTVKDKNSKLGEPTTQKYPIYIGDDKVSGRIDIRTKKKFEHLGVKIELVGLIEVQNDAAPNSTFMSYGLDLEPAGYIAEDKSFNFSFPNFQKPYESYYGSTVRLRYIVRATIQLSKFKSSLVKEQDIGVLMKGSGHEEDSASINMEVGIEEVLNIKIDFPRNVFHLKDVIEGTISFLTVKLMLNRMDLSVVRKEIIGAGEKAVIASEEINTFEIMDGCPIKGKLSRGRDPRPDVHGGTGRPHPDHDPRQQQILGSVLPPNHHP